jgi:signal transduction histidine kinase
LRFVSHLRTIGAPPVTSSPTASSRSLISKLVAKLMTEENVDQLKEPTRPGALAAEYEAKLNAAASLVARVRHEINNPLAALLGQAQLLLRDPELNDKQRRRAETIESQAKRIEEIVGELRSIQTPVRTLNRQED